MNKFLMPLIWGAVLGLWVAMILYSISAINSPIRVCERKGFTGSDITVCVYEIKTGKSAVR